MNGAASECNDALAIDEHVCFMRDLEARYRDASGLADRSHYKIFYGLVKPAPVLILGINPGGDPTKTQPDGRKHHDGRDASASSSFHEGGECDLLDCVWPGNVGLKKLLVPLLDGNEAAIRGAVVQTNLAFRRSARKTDIDMKKAMLEARPFVREIAARVAPRLVVLAGASIDLFVNDHATRIEPLVPVQRDDKVGHIVFAASRAKVQGTQSESIVVQVAHPSQFNWTYERYDIPRRIRALLDSATGWAEVVASLRFAAA
jgi:hypothetical protein